MMTVSGASGRWRRAYRSARRRARIWLEWSRWGFWLSLRLQGTRKPEVFPDARWHDSVLRDRNQVDEAVRQVRSLGLPVNADLPKNWDSLAALDLILRWTDKSARIFDAGGELYSRILQWLYLYGYRNLSAGNIVFERPIRKGSILYQYADITQTGFKPESFDAVTCLSVIEHGVNVSRYFREMWRILKPGGLLVTSTDYSEHAQDTRGEFAYGVPIRIFDRAGIEHVLDAARAAGLLPLGTLDLGSTEGVVTWKGREHLKYTFIVFSLFKPFPGQQVKGPEIAEKAGATAEWGQP